MEMKGTLDEKKNKNNCIILDYHAVPEYRWIMAVDHQWGEECWDTAYSVGSRMQIR
jgi:hypothetical protein